MATCYLAKKIKPPFPKRGFSLLEIVVSIFITALTLSLLLQIVPVAHRYRHDGDRLLRQALLAQGILERTLATPSAQWVHADRLAQGCYQVDVVLVEGFPQVRRLVVRVSDGTIPPLNPEPDPSAPDPSYRLETLAQP